MFVLNHQLNEMLYDTNANRDVLTRTHVLLKSPLFDQNSAENGPWRPAFAELISLVHSLLLQAQIKNKRVDFREGVGVHGKIQDITSLVEWLHQHLLESADDKVGQLSSNRLNRYFNKGTGYFANGVFFTSEYDQDLAFFLDDQRIYLHQQIERAVEEAERSLQN
jgi:hypothetical protein